MTAPSPATRPALTDALDRFVDWTRHTALPLWARRGFDSTTGRFEEALDFDGRPLPLPHRAMVQARQIYVFAHASMLGWHEDAAILADQAMATLLDDFCITSEGRTSVVFATDRRGAVVAPALDSYTHAFVLFALAWVYRLTGQRRFLQVADQILAFVTEELTDPIHGGLLDQTGAVDAFRRQNPLMHLLEACLALDEIAPDRGYLQQASDVIAIFERRLMRRGIVVEYSSCDWKESIDEGRGDRWEPGHHYEWAWLLERYYQRSGQNLREQAQGLCTLAAQHGHAMTGLIYDELSRDLTITGPDHRLWPHAEAIKAALCRHRGTEATPVDFAERMAELLMSRFLDRPFAGGWIDRINGFGLPRIDRVPASSLYHLMLAAAEAARITAIYDEQAANT